MSQDTVIWIALGVMSAGVIGLSLHHRLSADRAGGRVREQPRHAPSTAFVWIGRIALLTAIVVSIVDPPWMRSAWIELPPAVRWAALAVAAIFMALLRWMFAHLGRNITPTAEVRSGATLVTTGPYRYIRHPLYVFSFTWLSAAAVAAGNWLLLALAVAAFTFVAVRARREEANLLAHFGEAYRRYQQRTGRFFPRIGASIRL